MMDIVGEQIIYFRRDDKPVTAHCCVCQLGNKYVYVKVTKII